MTARLSPVSERMLERLPGSRSLWVVLWAFVPWLNAGANLLLGNEATSAVWEQSDLLVILNYAVLSLAVLVTLWGSTRLARRVEPLEAQAREVLGTTASNAFSRMNSVSAPLLLSALTAIAFTLGSLVRDGAAAAALRGVTWLLVGIALWSFLWTYVCLQLGLNRLGEGHLRRDAALIDPSLGLRPLGSVAFMGLWMLLVWLVPLVLTGLPDILGVALGGVILALGLGAFFLSLWRLHSQMVAVKDTELALARELYAEAYEPVREARSLEALEAQRGLLSAAEALEKRALAIHDWPVDQGTWAWVITIVTSVIALALGRLILNPLGI